MKCKSIVGAYCIRPNTQMPFKQRAYAIRPYGTDENGTDEI